MDDPTLDFTQDDLDELAPFLDDPNQVAPRGQPGAPGPVRAGTAGSSANLRNILPRFGIDSLRPEQQRAVDAILAKRDVFLCLPTGGGKSLCYQLPSFLIGNDGLTIVISPLVSLMANQVGILNAKGIGCGLINSTVSANDAAKLRSEVLQDTLAIRILYATPESFNNLIVLELFHKLKEMHRIDLFAIDEAHCISTWGHSFRPSYQGLSLIRSTFSSVPILACTATATSVVTNDIINTLKMRNPVQVKASFNRPNIYYKIVWSTSLMQSEQAELLKFIKKLGRGRGGIIYCTTRAGCERLSAFLTQSGCAAGVYHAGLPNRERERVQSAWETSEIDIVVATIAFGMGIHREDVSFIVHMNLPKSIESYYQETGRAGRNGKPAVAILFCSKEDESQIRNLLRREGGPDSRAMKLLHEMVDLCNRPRCHRQKILAYFGEQWEPPNPPKKNCCNFCDDPSLFQQMVRSSRDSSSSVRGVLALTAKRSKRGRNITRQLEISLIDNDPEEDDSVGIYRLQSKSLPDDVPKPKRPLTVDITDVQRDLCRRRICQALKQNRIAAGSEEEQCSLDAAVEVFEQSVFSSSSAKSDYMEKSRNLVVAIQSFSSVLCLYDQAAQQVPDLDLQSVQTRLRNIRESVSASGQFSDLDEIGFIVNALGKYFMTVGKLKSSGIGKDVNDLIKTMKAADLHLTQKQQSADLSSLLARWKDLARQTSDSQVG